MQYASVLLVLVLLEGLLAADNAIVMAVIVKGLDRAEQKKALFYGLFGAFILRFIALLLISTLVEFWWIQALGATYLIGMSIKNLWSNHKKKQQIENGQPTIEESKKKAGLWSTIVKVELTDLAFAIDSILAAVALL